jgi:ABC-type nitrate/sulfonate/bicarbonate transport system substrate-binding protein
VSEGKADFGIVSLAEFFTALEGKKDILAVSAFYQVTPSAIVSLRSSGISKPEDLVGKTVGITSDDRKSRLLTEGILTKAGIPVSAVIFKVIGDRHVEALLDASVDAVATYRTEAAYKLAKAGQEYSLLLPEDFGINLYGDILVTSASYLSAHPRVVRDFATATLAGWDYALEHKTEALESTMLRVAKDDFDREYQKFILDMSEPLMRPALGQPLGYMSPARWDRAYDLYYEGGLIGQLEIYDRFIPTYYFDDVLD